MSKKELSTRMKAALRRAQADAHNRVVERGLVQFRADRQLMEQLLTIADYKKMPVGPLVKSWIAPIVRQEYEIIPVQRVPLPAGVILTAESDVKELQQVLTGYEQGRIKLSSRQVDAVKNWLGASNKPVSEIRLSDGRVLKAKSPYKELFSAYNAHKRGTLKLQVYEYNAIVDWTIQQGKHAAQQAR